MKKKILAIFMMVLLCLPLTVPMMAEAANTSYKNWLQSDSAWADICLGTSNYTMKSSGCLVTAIAMLICHSGSADASTFTPATLVNYLNENGGFAPGGLLYWQKIDGAADGFKLVNAKESLAGKTQAQKTVRMAELLEDGYAVIISVRNGGHWVALDRIEGNTVYMLDPASSKTELYEKYDVEDIDRLAIYKGKYSAGSVDGSQDDNTDGSEDVKPEPVPEKDGVVNCSSLYVRSGAGTNNSIVTAITRNTKVVILGEAQDNKGDKWYKVRVSDKTGYVCARYITVTSSDDTNSGNNGSGDETASGTGVVNCSVLNVRSGAGTNNSVITSVSKNQSVTITSKKKDSKGDTWYGVSFTKSGKSYKGYVFAEYITLKSGSNDNTNDDNKDDAADSTVSIAAVVNCDVLNMRSGAGTGSSVVRTLKKGTAVDITGEKKDSAGTLWYQIRVDGKTGYVHSAYLTKKSSGGASDNNDSSASGQTMLVAYDAVNMRSGAGTSKGVVGVVHKGDKVAVIGEDKDGRGDTWYKVKTSSGKTGYIRSDLVKVDNSDSGDNNSNDNNNSSDSGSSDSAGQKMQVAYDGVNMRKGAGTSYGVVEVIYLEDTLTVLGQDKDSSGKTWYKVKALSGNTGYIRSDMLKTSASSDSSSDTSSDNVEAVSGIVVGGRLNVRSGAGTSCEVLIVIPEGTKVTVMETVKDGGGSHWYHITVNYGGSNYNGYVSAQYIQK